MGQTTPSDTAENHQHEVKHVASTAGRFLKQLRIPLQVPRSSANRNDQTPRSRSRLETKDEKDNNGDGTKG
jgi:hypothetical protein